MIDYTIKGKLRFNDPLTFTENHILYDCVEKLEQIENIITETENQHYELQGKKVVMNSLAYDKIKEVIENG